MEASVNGLPKVEGLEQVLKEANQEDKGQQQQVQDTKGQAPDNQEGQAVKDMTDDEILAQFKSTKDLLKSYKEIQGFTTRVSQENKAKDKLIEELNTRLNQLQEEVELRKFQRLQPPPVQQKSFEELFVENPEAAIQMKAMEMATAARIKEVAEEEYMKNPQEYMERIGWVQRIAQDPRYQALQYSSHGVKKLFQIADDARKRSLQSTAHKAIREIFGENVDIDKLKSILSTQDNTTSNPQTNNLNAYMPDTGTSTRTGQNINANLTDIQRRKQEAMKNGTIGDVAGAILAEALSK